MANPLSLCMDCQTELKDCPWMMSRMTALCKGQKIVARKRWRYDRTEYFVYPTIKCGLYKGEREQAETDEKYIGLADIVRM